MSNAPQRRVTLADIGRKAGYHLSTVGYALRNHPSIPEKTRAKIRKVAEELGYRPDPALSSLNAYRKNKHKTNYRTTIAIISDTDEGPSGWRNPKIYAACDYWKGMKERAEELGFSLKEFTVNMDRSKQKRVDNILLARGISTVIVAPLENMHDPIELSWERLSAVTIGYSLPTPNLPRMTHHHLKGMQTAVHKLVARGYRKIAYMSPYDYDERVGHAWSSGFFGACQLLGIDDSCSYFMPKGHSGWEIKFIDWVRENKPEVIVTSLLHLQELLSENGFRIPKDIGVAVLYCSNLIPKISGIDQNTETIGKECINLISSMYINNIRGVPKHPHVHLVEGFWKDNQSTRQIKRKGQLATL